MSELAGSIENQLPIGIDLGTTYSVVAYVDATGRPTTVLNGVGEVVTPSAIAIDEGGIVVGKEALKLATLNPGGVADCFKRDMGRAHFHRHVRDQQIPPEILSGLLLERLKQDAERRLGPIRDVVITVPAFFDESRRRSTQAAGRLAGLNVLDIINEPTAAAVAFAHRRAAEKVGSGSLDERILVYDLGGGTFDVTILQVSGNTFRTIATDGDMLLGGKDFDERIVNFIADEFSKTHGVDPRSDAHDLAQLWCEAQEVKHALSERQKTTVVCHHGGVRLRMEVTRIQLEDLIRPFVERTRATTQQVVRQAGLTWDQLDRVLLVGGSTRVPMVVDMIREISGKEPDRSLSADEAVAHGAALYAGMLQAKRLGTKPAEWNLVNVNSHSLGVVGIDRATGRKTNVILIPKNTRLPIRAVGNFETARTGQSNVKITVVEGESRQPDECIQLGQCVIRDLPAGLPKGSSIEVQYSYSADGRLSITGRIPSARQSAMVEIQRPNAPKLDSLDTWRQRLCGAFSGSHASTNLDVDLQSRTPDEMMKQLDESYVRLGRVAVQKSVPPQVEKSRQTTLEALRNLEAAEKALRQRAPDLERSVDRIEAIQLLPAIAKLKSAVQQLRPKAEFAILVLGRECVEAGFCPPELTSEWPLIQRLRKRLGLEITTEN